MPLAHVNIYNIPETLINIDILKRIEDDLDMDEKISILFLIIEDYTNAFDDIFHLFQDAKTGSTHIITYYIKNHLKDWKDKVLEALCILNNREIIKKLGVPFEYLDLQYFPNIKLCSKNINVIAKCLYRVCESLDESEQRILLDHIKSEIPNEPSLDDVDYLELHILYWIKIKYITISKNEKNNLRKLLKHLMKYKSLEVICMDLEKYENHLNVVDTHGILTKNDKSYLQPISLEEPLFMEKYNRRKTIQSINSGLCIIINQMYFQKEYETRFGSSADCANLSETFRSFGFKICLLQNLKKSEMLEQISNIPIDHGNEYDCLFLCVLSHGYKGGIITSDEKEVSLEAIEKAVCCVELQNVIKIVIIQACQGKIYGNMNNCLTMDGLSEPFSSVSEDMCQFTNFFMFMSTIQGFVSIRHKEQGSWFIQEVCRIFKTYANQLTFLDCVREIMTSVRKKRGMIEGSQIAQLTEIRQDRLNSDFQLKSIVAPSFQ